MASVSTRASAAQVVTNQGIAPSAAKARAWARSSSRRASTAYTSASAPSVATSARSRGAHSVGPKASCESAVRPTKTGG